MCGRFGQHSLHCIDWLLPNWLLSHKTFTLCSNVTKFVKLGDRVQKHADSQFFFCFFLHACVFLKATNIK